MRVRHHGGGRPRARPITGGTLLVAAVVLSLALAAGAQGIGELTYDTCWGNPSATGCQAVPPGALDGPLGPKDVTVSPDSRSVYVTSSNNSGSLSHFVRGENGRLTFDTCLAGVAAPGCVDLPFQPLTAPDRVIVSPDGASVYVGASGTLSHFFRDPGGRPRYDGCVANTPNGCTVLPAAFLGPGMGLAVSPDGGSFYATGDTAATVSQFFRAAGGQITFAGCVANTGNALGCTPSSGMPLSGATGIAVSPDGGSVYVASRDSHSLSHFSRLSGGGVVFLRCLGDDASKGCEDLPAAPLGNPSDVVVSPDGRSIYVGSSGALAWFTRAASGQIVYAGCYADTPANGCTDLPTQLASSSVAVSSDGRSVYTTGGLGLWTFARSDDGALTFGGCLSRSANVGCTVVPAAPFAQTSAVAVSPDGASVYIGDFDGLALLHFRRAGPAGPGLPGSAGSTAAPLCEGKRPTIMGSSGADRIVGTAGADVIFAGAGNDVVSGGGGNDIVCGGDGNDRLLGGRGNDVLRGGNGADGLAGGLGADRLFGERGNDRLAGNDGADVLAGGLGADLLDGGRGADRLLGGGGIDRLAGGGQRDVCDGGLARDVAMTCETRTAI